MHKLTLIKTHYGFSLLEVLVAFSIAAVSLTVLYQIYAKGTKTAILGEEYAQALVIAESRLANLNVSEHLNGTDEMGRENDRYDWEVSVKDHVADTTSVLKPALLLKQIEVKVTWDSGGKTRMVNLHSLRPVPAI